MNCSNNEHLLVCRDLGTHSRQIDVARLAGDRSFEVDGRALASNTEENRTTSASEYNAHENFSLDKIDKMRQAIQ
jgi:hypothetical protein